MLKKLPTARRILAVSQAFCSHCNAEHHHPINLPWSRGFNSWASAIKKAASSSSPQEALRLYNRMRRLSVPPDTFSLLFALKSCTHLSPQTLTLLRHLHAHLLHLGFSSHVHVATCLLSAYAPAAFHDARLLFDEMPHRNTVTWNVMITAYSRQQGDLKTARVLFDEMPLRDQSSWSTMIASYVDRSLWNNALALFRQMTHGELLKPDRLTVGPVLSGCSRMGSAGPVFGKSIHGFIFKNRWELTVEIGTCLVDMYAKCGLLNKARSVFEMMESSNVVTWTSLICGAAQHGYCSEALQMFEKMREQCVEPNEFTFTGILTACVQAGLVDEGRMYFGLLQHQFGLRPTIQHYGCMVDLFGKMGLLREAYETINKMPFEANVVIWGSFLSACKLHKKFEMAEKVMDKVLKMVRPENDGGVFSLVCDLYALNGRWSEVERVRDLMLSKNVRKVRGSSFVQSGDK
ncbi:Pentatricopeptide repeat-containing protein [Striga hermonthica]|uniref:Pentatricopeptide repeat-containing protein n=1 Tax=Striga hermonthica TaxID=68872 RepID=A0A9N7RNU3_STRHE|nr:Pentatricopeptide repeat-containing protein [Striga hermonthica]